MPKYRYVGRSLDNQTLKGTVRARDELELETKLINQGIFPDNFSPMYGWFAQTLISVFKRAEVTRITRQISILLKNGVSILETLELVNEQVTDKVIKNIFDGIIAQIQAGKSVAATLAGYEIVFDRLFVSMVEAGELSGELDIAFDRVAGYREKYEATSKKVRSAIAYPLLVILVAVLVVFALVIYVIPIFSSMYANFGAELPALTRRVVGFSDFLRNTIWYWIGLFVVGMIVTVYMGVTPKFKYFLHRALVTLPVVKKLTLRIITARFCRTMGSLLQSGVDIIYAVRIASMTTGNFYVNRLLEPSELMLAEGKSFTEAMSSAAIFPRAMLRLTASGEKTGRLGQMLGQAADYYERETEIEIGTLTSLIEPVIIIVLGVVIAFILIAMYLPLFELVGTI